LAPALKAHLYVASRRARAAVAAVSRDVDESLHVARESDLFATEVATEARAPRPRSRKASRSHASDSRVPGEGTTPERPGQTKNMAIYHFHDAATVFYATGDFGGRARDATPESVHANFHETLWRARPKELAHDYLEREPTPNSPLVESLVVAEWQKSRITDHAPTTKPAHSRVNDLDARQQAAAER
jgi:hypothetical protein